MSILDSLKDVAVDILKSAGHAALQTPAQRNTQAPLNPYAAMSAHATRVAAGLPTTAQSVRSTTDGRGSNGQIKTAQTSKVNNANSVKQFTQAAKKFTGNVGLEEQGYHNPMVSDYMNEQINKQHAAHAGESSAQVLDNLNYSKMDNMEETPHWFVNAMKPVGVMTGMPTTRMLENTRPTDPGHGIAENWNNGGLTKGDYANIALSLGTPVAGKTIKAAREASKAKKAQTAMDNLIAQFDHLGY